MSKNNERREFLKSVAIAGAAITAAGAVMPKMAEAIAPMIDPDLDGVIESHVHAAPDTHARCIDQHTLTGQFKLNGYKGVLYKCHDFITNDNAFLLRAAIPGIEVFGGIVLNKNYGDKVNVQAAKLAVQMHGGLCRCIWMPTYQSAWDRRKTGDGIPVLDSSGKVLPEVVQIMEICAKENIIFATGHSSPDETVILSKKAKEVGVKKCVITHCSQNFWRISLDHAKRCLDNGAYLEHSVLPYYMGPTAPVVAWRDRPATSMKEFAEYIRLQPEKQFINTDLGQAGNPHPIDGMKTFIKGLREEGLSQKQLDLISRKVPAQLLGLA